MVLYLPYSWSNWNLEMLVFEDTGKLENSEKNPLEYGRESMTNSTQIIWCLRWNLIVSHIGGRARALTTALSLAPPKINHRVSQSLSATSFPGYPLVGERSWERGYQKMFLT